MERVRVVVSNRKEGKGGERHDKGRQEWEVTYHKTEPKKITLCERRRMVDKMTRVWMEICVTFPETEVFYLIMFPRFVEECFDKHMTKDGVVVVDSIRRDTDKDIVEGIMEQDRLASIIQWWEVLGMEKDMTVEDSRCAGVVDKDSVHLTSKTNRIAAVLICDRMLKLEGAEVDGGELTSGVVKRVRW